MQLDYKYLGLALWAMPVASGRDSTQGLSAHRPVAALPTTANVLMLPVHVDRAALASNLVRQRKNLTFPIRRKRNLPPRIGILQDTVGHETSERVLNQNAIHHELCHMSGMRSRAGTRAGFELDRDQGSGSSMNRGNTRRRPSADW